MGVGKMICAVIGYLIIGVLFAATFSKNYDNDDNNEAVAWMVLYPILIAIITMLLVVRVLWSVVDGFLGIISDVMRLFYGKD